MGFGTLRVINDDIVEPGNGFGTHPHRDMEIFSYVIEGELQHRDSMGNGSIIGAGELQYMSAGSGVTHSEFNPSKESRVHFLQIWIVPDQQGGPPVYAERRLSGADARNGLVLLATSDGRDGSIQMRQQADIYFGRLAAGEVAVFPLDGSRGSWVQVIRGTVSVNGTALGPGDGAGTTGSGEVTITASEVAEFLAFVVPVN